MHLQPVARWEEGHRAQDPNTEPPQRGQQKSICHIIYKYQISCTNNQAQSNGTVMALCCLLFYRTVCSF